MSQESQEKTLEITPCTKTAGGLNLFGLLHNGIRILMIWHPDDFSYPLLLHRLFA